MTDQSSTSAGPVLVGIDLLPPSRLALEAAIPIARSRGVDLIMAHVAPMPQSEEHVAYSRRGIVERFRRAATAQLETNRLQLGELRERYSGRGVTISQAFVDGSPAIALTELADEVDAGLIVVGSFGRRGLDRFLLGSVAERVSGRARQDVMVTRQPSAPGGGLLVPIDFSDFSACVLQRAVELADGSPVTLLHCFDTPDWLDDQFPRPTQTEIEAMVTARLTDIAQPLRDTGVRVDLAVRCGQPKDHIVELAEAHRLVVMGSHGHRGLRRFFLGSVSSKTVRHAACSVYIARPRADAHG